MLRPFSNTFQSEKELGCSLTGRYEPWLRFAFSGRLMSTCGCNKSNFSRFLFKRRWQTTVLNHEVHFWPADAFWTLGRIQFWECVIWDDDQKHWRLFLKSECWTVIGWGGKEMSSYCLAQTVTPSGCTLSSRPGLCLSVSNMPCVCICVCVCVCGIKNTLT